MNQTSQQMAGISIQWVERFDDKYRIKFDKINVPVEMSDSYFQIIKNQLQE